VFSRNNYIVELTRVNAPDNEIKYAKSLRGTNWWDLEGYGDYDADDEKVRDW
jgi:hypothetical protein